MTNIYRGRLVSKNQMTIPVPMQRELDMAAGDELEFVIQGGRIIGAHVLKSVRVDLLPDSVLETLVQRRASGGAVRTLSPQEVQARSEGNVEVKPVEMKHVKVSVSERAGVGS